MLHICLIVWFTNKIVAPKIKESKSYIINFVDNEYLSSNSLAFRQHLDIITPDLNMTTTITNSSGKEIEVTIPVTVRFFWPTT